MYKANKSQLMVQLYLELIRKSTLTREEIKGIVGDSDRTVQRYINDLIKFVEHNNTSLLNEEGKFLFEINDDSYDMDFINEGQVRKPMIVRDKKALTLSLKYSETLNKKYVLILIKILLDTRALNENETLKVINHLLSHLCIEDREKIYNSIQSEVRRFIELEAALPLIDSVWKLNQCIMNKDILSITYFNLKSKKRNLEIAPMYITQDEFYFYLIGYNADKDNMTTLRVDRIDDYKIITNKTDKSRFKVDQVDQHNELGTYKNRTPLMFSGQNERITFEYYGPSIEAILDKFPDNKYSKLESNHEHYKVDINASGRGVYMWLLSQGADIKVISPPSAKQKMKQIVTEMHRLYE
ncbi:helix-turn-helix transcriptional regulator [Macrococcus armenti]|uniref:helix-turn-helix transcriptional regulator n=1 Tax=Macrococcus armenti TaxID=2875764 RepID=UPI001CCF0869|nr:WYL domain-containing protein [Macrococcus armenti]UBH15779.1 WYL domain-containing protein [Macrococcus armenti]UBH18138.1 WYL domain-containing protein [Macrococcus armenti]UBH20405.1 WYL domain-containing protein [Macrococcus armenti]